MSTWGEDDEKIIKVCVSEILGIVAQRRRSLFKFLPNVPKKKKKKNHQMANAWKKINYLGKFARDGLIVTDPWDAKEMVPFFPFLFLFNLFTLDKKVVVDGVRFSSASSSVAS